MKNGYRFILFFILSSNVFAAEVKMNFTKDTFESAQKFIVKNKLKKDYDFLIVDFHGEITSEKMAMGHFFDGKDTLVV